MLISESIYFYGLSLMLLGSASMVIFAPRMFLSVIALFLSFLFGGLLCLSLNAGFTGVFLFVLCGLILCPVIYILMNKISRWNLPLKLAKPGKIIVSVIISLLFSLIVCLFIREEFANSVLNIFNFVNEKSADNFNFLEYLFPMHIVIILMVVTFLVVRAIVSPRVDEEEECADD